MAKLYFRYSAMNAGKSTAMLQVAHNYEERDMNIALFTAAIDDRHSVGTVASRLGVTRQAEIFSAETNFSQLFENRKVACILIDEAQFLSSDQVRQLHILAHQHNLPVICYGLRADFLGMPFPGSAFLLALADDLEEMKTICLCGKKATMNARINAQGFREISGEQIVIGGNSRYLAMCAKCYYAAKTV
ncbi:thymidine kinase [Iodobacter sp. LRB]|uniref:thymidine kinase n=1 Tax=unclassified Iodobacter TaxID=235634 RepID=UPI000C0F393C|nr:thymidine kinase [Iodobacter sp. BJB302]PHV00224.1 thymidine kinase [Iodobacter sp. BJB302]